MPRRSRRLADLTSSLTLRGGCLVAAGLTLLVLGALLGERSLEQVALFVLALPVLATVGVVRARFRLASRRTVSPARLPRGQDADVLLEVTNTDRRAGGLWAMSEQLPADLGVRPRFLVERLPSGATAALRYRVHGARRGRHPLGPLRLRLVDPFGLVMRTTAGVDTATLLVIPRIRPLGSVALSGGTGGGAAGARRSLAVHGEDDVSTREYRRGDDLRKVHWRATARTGELMVRLEEKPWRSSATVFVDTRQRAHVLGAAIVHGAPGDPAPPPDTLEWVVEAAASIGDHLLARGADLRVVTDVGELTPAGGGHGLDRVALGERLATLTPSRHTDLEAGLLALRRAADAGPVVCLLGAVGPDDVAALARSRSGPGTDVAVLVDVVGWHDAAAGHAGRVGPGRRSALSAAARRDLIERQEQAAGVLRAGGWRVVTAGPQDAVEAVWARLGATSATTAVSGRAVPA